MACAYMQALRQSVQKIEKQSIVLRHEAAHDRTLIQNRVHMYGVSIILIRFNVLPF